MQNYLKEFRAVFDFIVPEKLNVLYRFEGKTIFRKSRVKGELRNKEQLKKIICDTSNV